MVAAAAGFYFLSVSRSPSRCERNDEPHDSRSRSTAGVEDGANDVGTNGLVTVGEHIATWSIWSTWNPCRQSLRGDLLLLLPSAMRAASWAGLGTCWQGSFSAARVHAMRLLSLRANLISDGDNALAGLFVLDQATQYWGQIHSEPKTALLSAKIRDMAMAGLFVMHRFWATCAEKASALRTVDGLGSVSPNARVPGLLAQRRHVSDAARRDAQPDRAEDVSVDAWIENVSNISPERVELRLSARGEQTVLCIQEDGTSDLDSAYRVSNASAGIGIPRVLVTRIKHSAPPHAQPGAAKGNSEQSSPISFSDDLSQEWTIRASRSDDFWENEAAEVENDDDEKDSEDERDGDAHSGCVPATVFSSRSPAAVNRSASGSVLSAGGSNTTVASCVPSSSTLFLIEDNAESRRKEEMLGRRGEEKESAPLARRLFESKLLRREEQEWNRLADLRRQEEAARKRREEGGLQMQAELSRVKRERDELEKRLREMEAAQEEERRRAAGDRQRERENALLKTGDLSIHGDSESNTAAQQKFGFEHGVSGEDVAFLHLRLPLTPPLSPLQFLAGIRDDDFWLSFHRTRSESGSEEQQDKSEEAVPLPGRLQQQHLPSPLSKEGGGGGKSVGGGERRTVSILPTYSAEMHPVREVSKERRESTGKVIKVTVQRTQRGPASTRCKRRTHHVSTCCRRVAVCQ